MPRTGASTASVFARRPKSSAALSLSPGTRGKYGAQRFIALGEYDGEVIRLVFTDRDRNIRIISARKANRNDRKTFEKARTDRQV
jgi:uncharacterized DUF497 family protein